MSWFDWDSSDVNAGWAPSETPVAEDYSWATPVAEDYSWATPVAEDYSWATPDADYGYSVPQSVDYWNDANYGYSVPQSVDYWNDADYRYSAPPPTNSIIQQAGDWLGTPGGKLMAGLAGAGISAYGANKQNKLSAAAEKKRQRLLAAAKAENQKYSSPAYFALARARQAPTQSSPNSEASWYANNGLVNNKRTDAPSMFAAEGGPVNEDRTSALNFIKYILAGRKLPSEQREEGVAQALRTGVPNKYLTRQQILDQQEREATGEEPVQRAQGGRSNYVRGGTSGQSDKIPAQLSDGEYIMDADVVSALGDGNNEAGAKKLDGMRQQIRTHKRAAPANKIPPMAKSPLAYMKKGAK